MYNLATLPLSAIWCAASGNPAEMNEERICLTVFRLHAAGRIITRQNDQDSE